MSDLVREFGVSDMTIRRDLEALADRGLVDKVHGGATLVAQPAVRPASPTVAAGGASTGGTASRGGGPAAHATDEPGFAAKSVRQPREKEAIAERAAQLVRPGTAVALSAGTTTWALARRLRAIPRLTVVTNSMMIADVFADAGQTVVLTGGIRTPSDALVGPVAVAAIRSLNVDMVFLGVHGMAPDAGFTTPNLMEAETNRTFVDAARRLVVVADHTKWETVGLSGIAPLRDADVLVTDSGLSAEARETLSAEVGELIIAEVPVRAGRP